MYIQNRRDSSKFNGYGPLHLCNGLIGLKPEIAYFAYTQRCAAYKKSQPHKQHIWFLPTQKPTLKKPKELLFANAETEIECKKKLH
jgi:hypothetical protein